MQVSTKSNNSWLYQKAYYFGFEWDKQEDKLYAPGFFDQRLTWLKNVTHQPVINQAATSKIKLKTVYPGLATGVGVTHESKSKGELKLGFEFDYTSGMPVIRGHSVKGALRAAFPQQHRNEVKFKDEKACQIYCWLNGLEFTKEQLTNFRKDKTLYQKIIAIENEIFDGKINGKLISNYTQDVFFDAFISDTSSYQTTKGQYLGSDSITPHEKQGMLKEPIPILFLKVLPGVEFEFRFLLHDNTLLSAKEKEGLFKTIISEYGIGAKTNVGYGQFDGGIEISNTISTNPNQPVKTQKPALTRTEPKNYTGKIETAKKLEAKVINSSAKKVEIIIHGKKFEVKMAVGNCPPNSTLVNAKINQANKKGVIFEVGYLGDVRQ